MQQFDYKQTDLKHVYTVYKASSTPHGTAIDVACFMFGRNALQTSRKSAAVTQALQSLNSHAKYHDLIVVKRKVIQENGTNRLFKGKDLEVFDKHGRIVNKVVKAVISDLEAQVESVIAPDNDVTDYTLNDTTNKHNPSAYVYLTLHDRILWDTYDERVIHYESRKKRFWGSVGEWAVVNKPSTPIPDRPFMTLAATTGGSAKKVAAGKERTKGKVADTKGEWVSTGRKAGNKTVYRNTLTGELRVRKMATRPDGSRHVKYVKFQELFKKAPAK